MSGCRVIPNLNNALVDLLIVGALGVIAAAWVFSLNLIESQANVLSIAVHATLIFLVELYLSL